MKNTLSPFGFRNPWKAFEDLEKDFFSGLEQTTTQEFRPSCSLKETEKHFLIHFDLPGVKKEDVHVEVENNRITVSGERKEEKKTEEEKRYFTESFYGSFFRSFELPKHVDANGIEARIENGVLDIQIPKTTATETRKKIEIK